MKMKEPTKKTASKIESNLTQKPILSRFIMSGYPPMSQPTARLYISRTLFIANRERLPQPRGSPGSLPPSDARRRHPGKPAPRPRRTAVSGGKEAKAIAITSRQGLARSVLELVVDQVSARDRRCDASTGGGFEDFPLGVPVVREGLDHREIRPLPYL